MATVSEVYRGGVRIAVLTAAALGSAVFFGFAAWIAAGSAPAVVGNTFLCLICLMLAARAPFTRVIATRAGITLVGVLGRQFYGWYLIERVSQSVTDHDGSLIPVKAPVLHLRTGRTVSLDPASSYSAAQARRRAKALEQMRRQHTLHNPSRSVAITDSNG